MSTSPAVPKPKRLLLETEKGLITSPNHAAELADSDVEAEDEATTTRCGRFWSKWKYVFILVGFGFLTGISSIVLNPIIPGIKRRYFGGDKQAALYTTSLNAGSSAIALMLCPLSGSSMDYFGRRPFFLLGTALNLASPSMLLFAWPNPLPYMWASAVAQLITSSYAATYIADHFTHDKTRMMAYSFVQGAGLLPIASGFLVTALSERVCVMISVGFGAASLVYAFFFIKESLPKDKLRGGGMQTIMTVVSNPDGSTSEVEEYVAVKFDWHQVENPWVAMKAVLNNKITIVTVIIMGIFTVSQSGVGEVYFYYLNEKVGFDKTDNASVLLEAGTTWPIVMFVLVPFAKQVLKLHSITLVMVSVVCLAVELIVMCLVVAKWQIFALALPMAAMIKMATPALTTVIADGSNGEDQGRRQAGLAAIGDFFGTLAPLFFGLIYSHTNAYWSFLPFAICAVLTIPTFALAYKLRHWLVVLGQHNYSRTSSTAPTPRGAQSTQRNLLFNSENADSSATPVQYSVEVGRGKPLVDSTSTINYGC